MNISKTIIDAAPSALFGLDLEGHVIFLNVFMRTLFRIDETVFEEGGPPSHLRDLIVDAAAADRFLERVRESPSSQPQSPFYCDQLALRGDGTHFPAEFSLIPMVDHGSSILIGMVRDVSIRAQALADLQLRQVAIESVANGIVITDRNGIIEWVNPAFTQMTGYSLEEARGKTPRLLRSGLHLPGFYENLWKTILAGQPWHGEMNNQRKDGTLYVEEMTITPVLEDTGEISHFIAVKNDITQRKSLEKLHEEMIYALVHDLRNPLGNILFSLEMLSPKTTEPDGMLQIARKSAQRLQGMVSSILDVNRLEGGHLAINPEPLAIAEMFDQVLTLQRPLAHERRLNLVSEIEPDLPLVYADAHLLNRVLQNLLDNALKYTPEGGEIRLTACLAVDDGYPILIGVHDQGEGIPESVREHMFEKFFTVQGGAQRRGTGLGLAFCKLAIEAHGGKIWAASGQAGVGASFYISLPLIESIPLFANHPPSWVILRP